MRELLALFFVDGLGKAAPRMNVTNSAPSTGVDGTSRDGTSRDDTAMWFTRARTANVSQSTTACGVLWIKSKQLARVGSKKIRTGSVSSEARWTRTKFSSAASVESGFKTSRDGERIFPVPPRPVEYNCDGIFNKIRMGSMI